MASTFARWVTISAVMRRGVDSMHGSVLWKVTSSQVSCLQRISDTYGSRQLRLYQSCWILIYVLFLAGLKYTHLPLMVFLAYLTH